MHFGVTLQHYREHASPEAIVAVAQAAEELGFDSVWVMDHVVVPEVPEAEQFTPLVYDPFVALSYVAAKTERVRLGTSVIILPYREPLSQAKMLATLDSLCGGRLDVGVGSGWLKPEFDALGVPFSRRGALTDEYLEVMRLLWTAEGAASYAGETVSFDNVYCEPKPSQKPHPPIWIGGGGDAALQRAVSHGSVWHPVDFMLSREGISDNVEKLRRLSEREGRVAPETRLRATLHLLPDGDSTTPRRSMIGTRKEVERSISLYASAGVTGFVLDTFYGSPLVEHKPAEEVISTLECFTEEIMPGFKE